MTHLTPDELIDAMEGLLAADRQGHLATCEKCQAQLAGLSELQAFLERGFTAFDALGGADEFLSAVSQRELAVSERLFGGHPDPFAQPNSSSR